MIRRGSTAISLDTASRFENILHAIENQPTSLEITGSSLVLLGDFNPAIFQPHWFSSQGLIPPAEAREAKDFVVHNELTVLKLPWVQVQVTHKQFIASTT